MRFQGAEYPKEADVRKAIELTVSQINSGTAGQVLPAKRPTQSSVQIAVERFKSMRIGFHPMCIEVPGRL